MKYIRMILLGLCCILALSGCGFFDSEEDGDNVVYVYNWGDYVDPDTLKQFEEETGIRVVMDEFDTNESMYPLVAAGAERYDWMNSIPTRACIPWSRPAPNAMTSSARRTT